MQKRDISYLTGILLIFVFFCMLFTGLIQVRFEIHRFIYHIYAAYLLIILAGLHVVTNWKNLLGFIKNKFRFKKTGLPYIVSIALILSLAFTLALGFLQVKLNFPRTRFVYHIYSAYLTLTLALIHVCLNFKNLIVYTKSKFSLVLGTAFLFSAVLVLWIKWGIPGEQIERQLTLLRTSAPEYKMAKKYHEKTKHTYAELMSRAGGLDWSRQPSVFKEYPQAELIKLSTDFDFDSISVEEAIEMGTFHGSFSGESITKLALSRILFYTNGITDILRYPGLTYYLRAAPSAGALYPTVIYLVVNNVEGLKKGLYHYSVKDHGLHFLKEGDFSEVLAPWVKNPTLIKKSNVVFIMSTIFYRTKWKYKERGYRYVLLDTGHVAENLTLIARALGLGSYPIGTFVDDKINRMLDIDGLKEAAVFISAVGRISALKKDNDPEKIPLTKKQTIKKLSDGLTIAELLHESGKLDSLPELKAIEIAYKSYPESERIYLSREFSKKGIGLDDAIRKRRSARDYSSGSISQSELSRILYYAYGRIKDNPSGQAIWSIEGAYPIEIYVVINNVEGIARGIYHYNALEHSLELLKGEDYRSRIANACLGQGLVGNANIAIIKTAVFERLNPYGDRGYRYVHLDAGAIGERIYLEAISMGLGVCGIGAFFDGQINEMLGIDALKETIIYVTSVGRL